MKIKYLKRLLPIILLNAVTFNCLQAQTTKTDLLEKADTLTVNNMPYKKFIGYGIQQTNRITSAITTVSGNDMEKNFALNAGNTLYGRLAGLSVQQAGSEPGAAVPGFFIRGRNTFGGNNNTNPLIVIDGIVNNGIGTANAFMQLVPEEIETVSILKDAASTAVYGSRAANGVILITTKNGKEGQLKVSFTTKQGFNQAQYIPKFLSAYNYSFLYNEALQNDGFSKKYSDSDLYAYQNNTDPLYHPNVNWYDQVLRQTAPVSSYDLNLTGGDKSVRYFVLLNALGSQGLYKKFGDQNAESSNSNFHRYNFRTNLDITFSKRLSAEFRVAGSLEQINNPYDYNTTSEFNLLASLPPNSFPVYNANGSFGGNSLYTNPVGNLLASGFFQTNARTILSSLKLTEDLGMIIKGLSISGSISINNYFKSGSKKTKQYPRYSPFKTTAGVDSAVLVSGSQLTSLSGTEETLDQYRNFNVQGILNYQRTFGKSDVSAMAMIGTDNMIFNAPTSDPTNPTANSTDPYKHNNIAGRFTYTYNNKYIAEFSMAYMGSENFAPGKRYGFFPAGSVGWIASNENFLKNNNIVNFLKFRGSYGLVGNDNTISPAGLSTRYGYTATFGGGGYFYGTGNTGAFGYAEANIANPDITWEKEKSLNIGFDATMFKNFNISFDYFKRDRYDILVPSNRSTPLFLGITTQNLNRGKSNDKGFDLSVGYNKTAKNGFQYFVSANVSYAKNKIIYNDEALQLNTQLYASGNIINQPLVYKAIGFFTQEDIDKRVIDPKSVPGVITEVIKPGDLKYQDIGGPNGKPDGIIDGNDLQPIGNPNLPLWTVGLNAGIKIKGFDLNFIFQGVTGYTVYLGGNYFNAFQNNGQISPIALGRWTPATAANATYPRLSSKNNLNNFLGSTFWQRDGSFIKLRSAEIGFTLPDRLTRKVKIGTFRIFVNGTNLFSLDHITYGDPESLSGYPVTRTLTLGAKIQL